jgi:hypothetical protein
MFAKHCATRRRPSAKRELPVIGATRIKPAALRLCNLVAQSPSDAEGGLQEGGGEGTDGAGDGTVRDRLLQAVPEPDAGH